MEKEKHIEERKREREKYQKRERGIIGENGREREKQRK